MTTLHCRDCPHWYGSEDDGYGPCTIKSQRGAKKPLTFGGHRCDEGYDLVAGNVVLVAGQAEPLERQKKPSAALPRPKPTKKAPASKRRR